MRTSRFLVVMFVSLIVLGAVSSSVAQTFTTLVNFDGTNGSGPYLTSLIQGADGNLYGVTFEGGTSTSCQDLSGCGTIYRMTPGGVLTTIYNFCAQTGCTDGYLPMGVTLATDGSFYGTTYAGGANGQGTVFKITIGGKLTTLYSFCALANCADGAIPLAGLTQAADGRLYGTTFGGANTGCSGYGCGTVFKITTAGQLTTLYAFPSSGNPAGVLIQGRDGNLYGTETGNAGSSGASTIFKVSPAGAFATVYQFGGGTDVYSGLVQGADGNLYGTSAEGGSNINGNCSNGFTCGTVFKTTPSGTLTTVYNFCAQVNCSDGSIPFSQLVDATDGLFYGTTYGGGNFGGGTIFSVSAAGSLTALHSFDGTDGAGPYVGLVQHTNGTLFGATTYSGTLGHGTVFSLNAGLRPFVGLVQSLGKVGTTVGILGQGFTGTTAVSFNGLPATYHVKSDTFMTAVVPTGATTGKVVVTTPGGTLTSNVNFRILQ
jgi:uncharacterized repeat protein (TIGR03803 family)